MVLHSGQLYKNGLYALDTSGCTVRRSQGNCQFNRSIDKKLCLSSVICFALYCYFSEGIMEY